MASVIVVYLVRMIMEGPLGWYGAEVDTKRNEKHVQQKTCKRIMTRYDNRKAQNIYEAFNQKKQLTFIEVTK